MAAEAEAEKEVSIFDYSFDAYFNYVVGQARKAKEESPYHGFFVQGKSQRKERTFYLL